MRVALFFDGKNHMSDLRRAAGDTWLDHGALAEWTVAQVKGERLVAAYYYTGIPQPHDGGNHRALRDLLEELDRRPGFFVRRFERRTASRECPHCRQASAYTEEKMVDTSLVAEMLQLAVADAYDVAVVFSGDLDMAPGLKAVRALGKVAWLATFGDHSLSNELVKHAWGHIDLVPHLAEFSFADLGDPPTTSVTEVHHTGPMPLDTDHQMVRELQRAEAHFGASGGFVGAQYFLHRWKGRGIPDTPDARRHSVQRLIRIGSVESYQVDGKTALRTADDPTGPIRMIADDSDLDDDETVEIRVTEAVRRLRAKLPT